MTSEPRPDDRRQHQRYACSCLVFCRNVAGKDEQKWWEGEALDIARGGLQVTCERPFNVGDVLKIRLQRGEMETALLLTARVARVSGGAGGKWIMGCQLAPILRPDEVNKICQPSE